MDDELLSDILAVELEIRVRIGAKEQQTAERLEKLRRELDRMLDEESRNLQAELEQAQQRAEQEALLEANALLAEARNFASKLEKIDALELDRVVVRHLSRILPESEQ